MSGICKFATEEMKQNIQACAASVAAGQPGPQGYYDQLVEYLPKPIPTEAWALYDASGALYAAWSADGMNAWYFHADLEAIPEYTGQDYPASDTQGNPFTLPGGEAGLMQAFIKGDSRFFYLNGERFTQVNDRDTDSQAHSYFVNCSSAMGRGAFVHLDTEGKGASIFVYSSNNPVATEVRMGLSQIVPEFSAPSVDARTLPGILSAYASEYSSPFWIFNQ